MLDKGMRNSRCLPILLTMSTGRDILRLLESRRVGRLKMRSGELEISDSYLFTTPDAFRPFTGHL